MSRYSSSAAGEDPSWSNQDPQFGHLPRCRTTCGQVVGGEIRVRWQRQPRTKQSREPAGPVQLYSQARQLPPSLAFHLCRQAPCSLSVTCIRSRYDSTSYGASKVRRQKKLRHKEAVSNTRIYKPICLVYGYILVPVPEPLLTLWRPARLLGFTPLR